MAGYSRDAREPRVMLGEVVDHADLPTATEAQQDQIMHTRIAQIEAIYKPIAGRLQQRNSYLQQ